jgi:C-terminal processing protease CtpA/Prc
MKRFGRRILMFIWVAMAQTLGRNWHSRFCSRSRTRTSGFMEARDHMMTSHRTVRLSLLVCCLVLICRAQLTTEQKVYDFQQLATFYDYNYAPAAWKKQVFGFDLRDTGAWFDRVQRSIDDLGFYEICYEYVASLNDSHSRYQMSSNWSADLGFEVDNYDVDGGVGPQPAKGAILIDRIDRSRLPADQFPFQVGDELLSLDGVGVEEWILRLSKWAASSNSRGKRSMAARAIVARSQAGGSTQAGFPRAPLETEDSAVVQIRRQSGAIETYTIKWQKNGIPVLGTGQLNPEVVQVERQAKAFSLRASTQAPGSLMPEFAMPPGFQQRLGKPGDFFFSGVFPSAGKRIGYIRIPVFAPLAGRLIAPEPAGIAQFAAEAAYMQAHTDALVVDVMHNPGGSPTYADTIYSYLSPQPYEQLQVVWRPNLYLLRDIYSQLVQAEASHADPATNAFYWNMFQQVGAAYAQSADLTPPYPQLGTTVVRDPARDDQGNIIAYTKPMMLLTDDQSVSAADAFAALFQDNQRGLVFGIRTNGGGGNVWQNLVGVYSRGIASAEINLVVRNHIVNVPGYPPTRYIENVGVQPDIVADLMTKENLLNNGASLSQTMVAAITNYLLETKSRRL